MTLPVEPKYGIPHENAQSQPLASVTGGSSGTEPISAYVIADELERIDDDVADHGTRLATIEGQGVPSWVKIASGVEADVASFVIDGIPNETYSRVRLTLFGQNEAGTLDPIRIRFNSDNTAGLHTSGLLTYDAAGDLDASLFSDETTFWDIAVWSTLAGNTAIVEIINTHVSSRCSFQAHGANVGNSAGTHRTSRSWGYLEADRLLDSLRVSGPSGTNFSVSWWLEGSPV